MTFRIEEYHPFGFEEYYAKKIIRRLDVLTSNLPTKIAPEILRLLDEIKDQAMIIYIRDHTEPHRLRSLFAYLRDLVEVRHLIDADQLLDQFEEKRRHLQGLLLRYEILRYRGYRGRPKGSSKVSGMVRDLDRYVRTTGASPTTAARKLLQKRGRKGQIKGAADHLVRLLKK